MRALGLALVLLACQAPATPPTACQRDSDCAAPLVCGAGRCRTECAATRDCPPGSECLPLGAGTSACSLERDRCVADEECTAPLICGADGQCRAACLSDADCTSDGHCELAGRLVCVATVPPRPSACAMATNIDFALGLSGWCVETSSDLDASVVTAVPMGVDHHAARIDLGAAPVGAWARLYQEIPFHAGDTLNFDRVSAAVDGATTTVAIELLDDHGTVLGRVARAVAGDGASECDETGRPSARCYVEPYASNVVMVPAQASWIESANVDLRRVASVRRVFELARTGQGSAELIADDAGIYPPNCPLGWWRQATHIGLFDLDDTASPPPGFSENDAIVRVFPFAECGQALALDGTQSIDWTGTLPPVYTVSFDWCGTVHLSPLDGVSFVHEIGGDMSLSVVAGQITLRACGVSIADSALVNPDDVHFQEMQVLVDRTMGRVCLARSGHTVGCTSAPACAGAAVTATGLRFAERATPFVSDTMGIDEIRIDEGVQLPDGSGVASGDCTLDLACHEPMSLELRDVGSSACVATSACTSTWLCPAAAQMRMSTLCGSTADVPCVVDSTCPFGVRPCDGTSCVGYRVERCIQPLAVTCP